MEKKLPHIEIKIGKIMFACIFLAVFILLITGCFYLARHGQEPFVAHNVANTNASVNFLHEITTFNIQAFLLLGLFVVVVGQILRVFLTGILFVMQRDWIFVAISAFIFLLLLYNLF